MTRELLCEIAILSIYSIFDFEVMFFIVEQRETLEHKCAAIESWHNAMKQMPGYCKK